MALGGSFEKSGGNFSLSNSSFLLLENLTWTSDSLLEIKTLDLDNYSLTLGSASSDLKIIDPLNLDHSDEKLISGAADLEFSGMLSISGGEVTSTAGTVAINGTSSLSSGTFSVSSGTLAMGGGFEKNGGTLSILNTSFSLLDNLTWTSDSLLEIKTLELDNFSLTLGSESSDLKIIDPLTLDHSNEKLISGAADLEFSGLLSISLGELSSSNGKIQLEQGVILSGGEFKVPNSTLVIGNQFNKTGGSANLAGTNLQLFSDLSLTSDTLLSIQSLDLNQQKLTLSDTNSDLEVQNLLEIDDVNEGLITGNADLELKQGISISAGEVTSTAGTVAINGASSLNSGTLSLTSGTLALGGSFEKSGGTLSLSDSSFSLLENLTWTSDSLLEIKTLELDNFSLTLGSPSSDLKIIDPLALDHSNEKLISGAADLEFSGLLNI
ncbi:MAG: hypothetical protein QF675_11155, partial [SAR324 cluster bacterium]|nr:hypothetical protein [SAR324 cluster bacterium]